MKLEAVKKYNKPKYPDENKVKENKELLSQPLDKWMKIGITSTILLSLLMKLNEAYASEKTYSIINNIEPIATSGIAPAPIEHRITNEILGNPTKKVIQNYSIVDRLSEYDKNITTTEFGKIIETFFDWLLVQGIM